MLLFHIFPWNITIVFPLILLSYTHTHTHINIYKYKYICIHTHTHTHTHTIYSHPQLLGIPDWVSVPCSQRILNDTPALQVQLLLLWLHSQGKDWRTIAVLCPMKRAQTLNRKRQPWCDPGRDQRQVGNINDLKHGFRGDYVEMYISKKV